MKKITASFVPNTNLRPLSEYSGTILKLRKKDKAQISLLETSITKLECDIYAIDKQIEKAKKLASRQSFFLDQKYKIVAYIEDLKNSIRQIKIDRLNKQKAQEAKKKGVL